MDKNRWNYIQLDDADICNKYVNGISIEKLAKENSVSNTKIRWVLIDNNIKIRPNVIAYNINHDYFNIINTEEKAYILGLLYADGTVSNNKNATDNTIVLRLQSTDISILEKINKSLESNRPIYIYKNNGYSNNDYAMLTIKSRKIRDELIKKGCTPNKTHNLMYPDINVVPDNLQHHFIRGFLDGDGSIHYDKTNDRNMRVSFCGTKYFLIGLQKILISKCDITETKIMDKGKIYVLEKGGRLQLENILNYIYKDAIIYMERKYEKYQLIHNYNLKNGLKDKRYKEDQTTIKSCLTDW